MKNILVPTDFSDCARQAENIGLEIAEKAKAEIHFLHIISSPVDWLKLSIEKEQLYPETKAQFIKAETELKTLVERANKMGVNAKKFIVFNKGREEIEKHAKIHEHDFVVMGSSGSNGVKDFIGSNAQKVVRYSPAPVLVVKNNTKINEIKNIVFASTFEENIYESFLKVIEFADLVGAKIHLLNVNVPFHFKETDEAEAKMFTFLNKCPKGTCSINIYNALNENRGIQKFSKKIGADIVALTTHGKTGLMKLLSHSVTEQLVNSSDVPVLSVNINNR